MGSFDSVAPDRYEPIAVFNFASPRGARDSGEIVADMVRVGLEASEWAVIDRATVQRLLDEQRRQSRQGMDGIGLDEETAIKVGKLAGARIVIVGTVQEWNKQYMDFYHLASVAVTLRAVDVATGVTLFDAKAQYARSVVDGDLKKMAAALLENIRNRFSIATGFTETGMVGLAWTLSSDSQARTAVVAHVASGLPAERSGVRVGDRILACGNSSSATWETYRQGLRACRVAAGQKLTFEVGRGEARLSISMVAVDRTQVLLERTTDR
ncbi:MAG: hypothetical protein EPO64_13750 [Nitrospirae bacterium]|nr:MAG: hypothetical protein EPO64_13750 [Nitrospirota bacterium]